MIDIDSVYHRAVRSGEGPALPDGARAYVHLRVLIGAAAGEPREWFQLVVCTPGGLSAIRRWARQPAYRPQPRPGGFAWERVAPG